MLNAFRALSSPPRPCADGQVEIREELLGELARVRIDEARAKLGKLALPHLRRDVVAQPRFRALVQQRDVGPPLAKPAIPPLPSPDMV